MLEQLRRQGRSTWSKVLLYTLAAVFCFWGIGYGFFARVHPVATVNGQRILAADLDKEANRLRQTLQQIYGANAPSVLRGINLRQEALDQLVERQVISNESHRLGISVSDAELQRAIASDPSFQVDGQFDFQRYNDILASNDLTPNDYEASRRAQLVQSALQEMVENGVQVSDAEARDAYNLGNQKIALAYIEVPYQDFAAKISPTEQQLQDYYKAHTEEFREPERIKISYVHYDPQLLAAKITPTDDQIADYYKTNLKKRFTHPDQVHASHILIAVPAGASQAEKDKAKAKAEQVLAQAQKKGADFAKLARQYSDDPATRMQGGDLGTFGRNQMIKPFEDAVFSMKPGELRLVETRFGYHVVKLDAFIPAHTDTLADAKPKIIEALKGEAGERIAREALNEDVSGALSGRTLQDIAKKRGIEVVETPAFSKDDAMTVVHDPKLVEAAFKLDPGQVSAVPSGEAPYLVKLLSREPSHIPSFKDAEAKVREHYVRATAVSQARAQARQLLEQIKSPADFDKVAADKRLTVHHTDPVPRSSNSIPGVGQFPEVTDAAATVAQVPGIIDRLMENRGDSYIFEITARSLPSDDEWKSDQKTFTEEFLQQRRGEAWTRFLEALRRRADVKIDRDQLGQASESSE
jgi:peptidyl-prolyl cis-trans isomerase D